MAGLQECFPACPVQILAITFRVLIGKTACRADSFTQFTDSMYRLDDISCSIYKDMNTHTLILHSAREIYELMCSSAC